MFRRLNSSLPKDPDFPTDLQGLGYFITEQDEIRSIEDPTESFEYYINKNERWNERHKEAMNICIRKIVLERLQKLGMEIQRVPLGRPANKPHIPILISRNLSSKKRVILIINEAIQDLGIWAYRVIGGNDGPDAIDRGSAAGFIKTLQKKYGDDAPGLIIANPGQLLWWRGGKRSLTFSSWDSLPRKTAVHGPFRIDDVKNRVDGNRSVKEHVAYMFNDVLTNLVADDARVFVIGLSDSADEVIHFLNDNWSAWASRIGALALGSPLHSKDDLTNSDFAAFFKAKARAYLCSSLPANSPIPDGTPLCPAVASGEEFYTERIIVAAGPLILDFFADVVLLGDRFVNSDIEVFGDDLGDDRQGRDGNTHIGGNGPNEDGNGDGCGDDDCGDAVQKGPIADDDGLGRSANAA